MKFANFLVGMVSVGIMIVGAIIPFLAGAVFSLFDFLSWFFKDLDAASGPPVYYGGFIVLVVILLLVLDALILLPINIVSYISAKKDSFASGTALYIIACVFTGLGVLFELFSAIWLNVGTGGLDTYMLLYYIWPIIGAVFLIAMIVLSALSLKQMR